MPASSGLHLGELGTSEQQALRRVLSEFRFRGWQDTGDAALQIIQRIAREPGLTAVRAARAAPSAFFAANRIGRRDLEIALADMANKTLAASRRR